jgi:hypothetical protein
MLWVIEKERRFAIMNGGIFEIDPCRALLASFSGAALKVITRVRGLGKF